MCHLIPVSGYIPLIPCYYIRHFKFCGLGYFQISNILFFILPPLLMHLSRQYAQRVNQGVNIVWVLLGIVGVGSVYFHATLSLVGQLLDEIAIIWVVMASMALWFPKHYLPLFMQQDR